MYKFEVSLNRTISIFSKIMHWIEEVMLYFFVFRSNSPQIGGTQRFVRYTDAVESQVLSTFFMTLCSFLCIANALRWNQMSSSACRNGAIAYRASRSASFSPDFSRLVDATDANPEKTQTAAMPQITAPLGPRMRFKRAMSTYNL